MDKIIINSCFLWLTYKWFSETHFYILLLLCVQFLHDWLKIIDYIVGAEKDDGSIDGAISEGAQQGAASADVCIETTVPKQGQNLW